MDELLKFLNDMDIPDRKPFCDRCETTEGYLRKACSNGEKLRESLCINLERETGGKITCEKLRPDVDWAFIRGTSKKRNKKVA